MCVSLVLYLKIILGQSHFRAMEMNWSGRKTGPSPFLIFTINLAELIGLLRIGGHRWRLGSQTMTETSVTAK